MNKFVYVDASASWLKQKELITVQSDFLQNMYANAGRGVCLRAGNVDKLIQDSRKVVADFVGAEPQNIVWTAGTTDSLNRIVNIIKNTINNKNIVVAVSDLDHHSARLPFEKYFENVVLMPLDENLNIDVNGVPYADVVVITAMSNVLGRAQDVQKIIASARAKNPNVITIVDASQYVVHHKIDVKKWDCDFLVFSGHKIGSDTGVGVLYIRYSEKYFPDKFGGGMVSSVGNINIASKAEHGAWIYENEKDSCWVTESAPTKWEAGTLPLTQIVGLGVAIDELNKKRPDLDLIKYAYDELAKMEKIKVITSRDAAILTFVVPDMHPLDIGALIGAKNICVRVGNMCASWIHKYLGVTGSVRISVGPWNTMDEIKQTVNVIKQIVK